MPFSSQLRQHYIDQVEGRAKPDIVIKNTLLSNAADASLVKSDIAISGDGTIVDTYGTFSGVREVDAKGRVASAGLVDAHGHSESSCMTLEELEMMLLQHGITSAFFDPHEIGNVVGEKGVEYMLECASKAIMDARIQIPTCVPATPLETSGAEMGVEEMRRLRRHPKAFGGGEFMNTPSLTLNDPAGHAKIDVFEDDYIGGHMPPGTTSRNISSLKLANIRDCHELIDLRHAQEKLRKMLMVHIRGGSADDAVQALRPLMNSFNAPRLAFCTDDRKANDLAREGGIDNIVRRVIKMGVDPHVAYRIATLSAMEGFGIRDRGVIAPGYKADILLLNDFKTCDIHSVFKDGVCVVEDGKLVEEIFAARKKTAPVGLNSVKIGPVTPDTFAIYGQTGMQDVIVLIKDKIITGHAREMFTAVSGKLHAQPSRGLVKMVVMERHGKNGNMAMCFVKWPDFKDGAIVTSVSHDSHNVIALSTNDVDLAVSINRMREVQGGMILVRGGKVIAEVPLPRAGLMSDKTGPEVARALDGLKIETDSLCPGVKQPFLHASFLSLPVIGDAKLTDYGMTRFVPGRGPMLLRDQRSLQQRLMHPVRVG